MQMVLDWCAKHSRQFSLLLMSEFRNEVWVFKFIDTCLFVYCLFFCVICGLKANNLFLLSAVLTVPCRVSRDIKTVDFHYASSLHFRRDLILFPFLSLYLVIRCIHCEALWNSPTSGKQQQHFRTVSF